MKKAVCILLSMLLLTGCCFPAGEGGADHKEKVSAKAIAGFCCEDGTAVIPKPDGTVVTVRSSHPDYRIHEAWLLPDENRLVYTEVGDTAVCLLYYTDPEQQDSECFGTVFGQVHVRPEGVLFNKKEKEGPGLYRFTFADEQLVRQPVAYMLMDAEEITVAPNSLSCLYDDNGSLYVWPGDAQEPVPLGAYTEGDLHLSSFVSRDGRTCLWVGEGDALFFYDGEKRTTISTNTSALTCQTSLDGKVSVIFGEDVYIWRQGETLKTVELPFGHAYGDNGPLEQCRAEDTDTLYILAGKDLYAVDRAGAWNRLAEGMEQIHIDHGKIAYIQNERLNIAALRPEGLADSLQVATGVYSLQGMADTLYYTRNDGLYRVDFEQAVPEQISPACGDYYPCENPDWVIYEDGRRYTSPVGAVVSSLAVSNGQTMMKLDDCYAPNGYGENGIYPYSHPDGLYYFRYNEEAVFPCDLYWFDGVQSQLVAEHVKLGIRFRSTGFEG